MVRHRRAQGHAGRDLEKLNKEINAPLADPRIKVRLAELGGEPMPMSPGAFGKFIVDETEKWAKVIRALTSKSAEAHPLPLRFHRRTSERGGRSRARSFRAE